MESVSMLGELLPQLIVLLLPLRLLVQLDIPLRDDLLQVSPGLLQRLHVEPGVRIRTHVEALDLPIERGQRVEVCLGARKRGLELCVGLAQRPYLFDGVAANRVGEVLLGVLEPRVESGRPFREGEEEVFDLTELFLHVKEALLALV